MKLPTPWSSIKLSKLLNLLECVSASVYVCVRVCCVSMCTCVCDVSLDVCRRAGPRRDTIAIATLWYCWCLMRLSACINHPLGSLTQHFSTRPNKPSRKDRSTQQQRERGRGGGGGGGREGEREKKIFPSFFPFLFPTHPLSLLPSLPFYLSLSPFSPDFFFL